MKQQAEAKETETLLRSLSAQLTSSYNDTFSDCLVQSSTKDENREVYDGKSSNLPPIAGMDIASSTSTGIDYGFISRSEGNQRGNMVGGLPVEGYYTNRCVLLEIIYVVNLVFLQLFNKINFSIGFHSFLQHEALHLKITALQLTYYF